MAFLELVNRRLDHVKAYNSASHYRDYCYMAQEMGYKMGNLMVSEISRAMVQDLILERNRVSACTANQELRYLKGDFQFRDKGRVG